MSRREFQEESPPPVPVWVMSFGDMVTNLMACFVLLLSMASRQSSTLFYVGQGSFRRAIAGFGIPDLLFGKEISPGMNYRKLKYPTEEAEEEIKAQRVLDADDENIRTIFADLKRQLDVEVSAFRYRAVHYEVVANAFEPDRPELRPAARAALETLAQNASQNFRPGEVMVYVIARADGAGQDKNAWRLSALRAQSASRHLRTALTQLGSGDWRLCCWGDGAGEQLIRRFGPQASVVVVVMKLGEANG
jgi:flagellar motor protein MotB